VGAFFIILATQILSWKKFAICNLQFSITNGLVFAVTEQKRWVRYIKLALMPA
jgi:hypothetical protein